MGTARGNNSWEFEQDRACTCGVRDCALVGTLAHERRLALIAAQERAFDEATRMADIRRPLLLAGDLGLTANASAA